MEKKYLLVLDAGTGAARCSIFNIQGNIISSDYCEWNYATPYDNKEIREFDPGEFWSIFCKVIKTSLEKSGILSDQIIGISSTSQREGIVMLDDAGTEIYAGPNIDFRGEEQGEYLKEHFGQKIYDDAGHWPSAMTAPSRLMWFRQNRPEVYEKMSTLLMINDWILYRLTGKAACEPTNACESLFYNIREMKWNYALMDKVGVSRSLFPKVLSSGSKLGEVSKYAAEQTGLSAGTPVYLGGADTQCAVLGTGGIKDGHMTIVSGTSTPVMTVVGSPIIDPKARVRTGCYLTESKWVLDSNARPTGVVYRWLRDTLYGKDSDIPQSKLYKIMDREAMSVPPGCNGVMAFLGPSILNVSNMRDFPGVFTGVTPGYEKELCNRGIFSRSILENIAFAVRGNMEQLYDVLGKKPDRVYMAGGAVKAPIQLKITANVVGLPVYICGCCEATSLGAAICAAVGAGIYGSFEDAVENMVEISAVEYPNQELSRQYEKLYRRWKRVYDHLTENYKLFLSDNK